jgi:tyrosyl-tRNA synthetase
MSIPDALVSVWAELLGSGAWDDLRARAAGAGESPMLVKQELARRLVARFHGEDAAERAALRFRREIQEGALPEELPELAVRAADAEGVGLLDLLRQAFALPSNGEARRLVAQGAVQIDDRIERDPTRRIAIGSYTVRAGKRRFARVNVEST